MLFSLFFFFLIDDLLGFNMIGFIPEQVKEVIKFEQIGMGELFGILFVVFEFLSVLKNMYKCKLPIPKKFKIWLEKILSDYTEEIKKGELENGKEETSSKEDTKEGNGKKGN